MATAIHPTRSVQRVGVQNPAGAGIRYPSFFSYTYEEARVGTDRHHVVTESPTFRFAVSGAEDDPIDFAVGVVGGTEYPVEPGDLVFVFRNTAHFFDPISSKFGYLLVDLPQSEPLWPKSIVPNGTGAY